jgi:uncharacterized membrane protein YfcA
MDYLLIAVAACASYVISTVGGGGGSLLLVPVLSFLLGSGTVAPVLSVGELISRPVRLVIFWQDIEWRVVKFHVPGSILGAFAGAYIFTHIDLAWLQIVVGLFLVSTVFQYRFGEETRSFPMPTWAFLPLGFVVSLGTAVIGAVGPVLNPFYLNYGLEKERLIGTKTIISFLAGLVQIGTYTAFGALAGDRWLYGVALGVGAGAGSLIGKRFLSDMESRTFRRLVIVVMVISGLVLIYQQVSALFSG